MDKPAIHPAKRKGLQAIVASLIVCLMIVLAVGVGMYFLNQQNDVIPDAKPPNLLMDGSDN